MTNPKIEIAVPLVLGQYTQEAIKQSQLRRWLAVIRTNSFFLNPEDTALHQKIIESQLKPGFPDF